MEMQHLNEREVVVGQPVPWNIYDRNGHLLLHAGVIVQSTHQIEELKERGLFVRTDDWDTHHNVAPQEKVSPFMLLDGLHGQMERMFGRLSVDDTLAEKVLAIASIIQQACEIDKDATLASIFIGEEARYVVVHPLNVAILCEVVAKHFGRPQEERLNLLAAALTMNITTVNLQTRLHAQSEPLTEEQRLEVRNHAESSVEILKQKGVTEPLWLTAVLQHHEKLDGSGYPQGLAGSAIAPMARLITLADIYCALVTGRAYRPGMMPNVAMREVFLQRGKQIDPVMAEQFVKIVGLYPPGAFVRLMNGDLAVVTRHGKSATAPIVHSVAGPWGAPMTVYIKRDCSQEKFAVREPVSKQQADIKVNRHKLWGYQ